MCRSLFRDQLRRLSTLPFSGYRGSFVGVKAARAVKLITRLHLLLSLRVNRSMNLHYYHYFDMPHMKRFVLCDCWVISDDSSLESVILFRSALQHPTLNITCYHLSSFQNDVANILRNFDFKFLL